MCARTAVLRGARALVRVVARLEHLAPRLDRVEDDVMALRGVTDIENPYIGQYDKLLETYWY